MEGTLEEEPDFVNSEAVTALTCIICLELVREPVLNCSQCKVPFCGECIRGWGKKCPACRSSQHFFRNRTAKGQKAVLHVRCSRCAVVCEWIHLSKHLNTACPFRLISCVACHENMMMVDQSTHVCPRRPVPCPNCQHILPKEVLQLHLSRDCRGNPPCPLSCGLRVKPDALGNHLIDLSFFKQHFQRPSTQQKENKRIALRLVELAASLDRKTWLRPLAEIGRVPSALLCLGKEENKLEWIQAAAEEGSYAAHHELGMRLWQQDPVQGYASWIQASLKPPTDSDAFELAMQQLHDLLCQPFHQSPTAVLALVQKYRERAGFQFFYQRFLAHRLIYHQFENPVLEHQIIDSLDYISGKRNLLGMIQDAREAQGPDGRAKCRKGVMYLLQGTQAFWPQGKDRDQTFHLPPELKPTWESYRAEYAACFSQRRQLKLQIQFGRAEIEVYFAPTCTRTLICSSPQMLILMTFNNQERLTYAEMLKLTGLSSSQLDHQLLSMVHPKIKIILKKPACRELTPNDLLMLNPKFPPGDEPFWVPLMAPLKTKAESDSEERINFLKIRAKVLRVIKIKRELTRSVCIAEAMVVLGRAGVHVTPVLIHNAIQSLHADEYIKATPEKVRYLF